jgi:hypothetical protein
MSDEIDYDRLARALGKVLDNRDDAKPKVEALGAVQVEEIARRAAKEAVEAAIPIAIASTLISFGLDPMQRGEIQRDFLFIRDMRTLSADSRKHILFAVLSAITLGIVSAVWLYLKSTGKAG